VVRTLLSAAVVFVLVGTILAEEQPAPPLVTKTYDLKPILNAKSRPADLTDTDSVIRLILQTLRVGELKPDGAYLIERENGLLEVRTTAGVHDEIKDLLDALQRLTDIAIDVKADVIEFDPAPFEKLLEVIPKPVRGRSGSPVLLATGEELEDREPTAEERKAFAEVNKILKAGRTVQTSTARFANGVEATLSARQSVVPYTNRPAAEFVGAKPLDNPQYLKDGFRLAGLPVVSADRRFVRFRLTEQSTVVVGIKERVLAEVNGEKIVVRSPEMEDLGATGSAVVADGGTLLFRLAYAPKGKVWVVVLHPRLFIQAEEDAIKGKP
jgi:hypothetical protein